MTSLPREGHELNFARGVSMLLVIAAATGIRSSSPIPTSSTSGEKGPQAPILRGRNSLLLGSTLVRIETQIALGALISSFEKIELATDDLQWRPHINLRGLESLPVRVG
jgi:hypothetical protein